MRTNSNPSAVRSGPSARRIDREAVEPGLFSLLREHRRWIRRRRVGLLSHPAAVDRRGFAVEELLCADRRWEVTALFGPEHGYFGAAGAGQRVRSTRHPVWHVPVYSLYGAAFGPSPAALRRLDAIVVDLQGLAARPYTYVSTLRRVLESAAAHGKTVIVCDRPVPLARIVDGPPLDPRFRSFVADVPVPMAYGMTLAEAARWIKAALGLNVCLRVAPMAGYRRQAFRGAGWAPWIPPSPGIRSWESALCYLTTVFAEALPDVDHGRLSALPFQVLGAPWLRSRALADALRALRLDGATFHPHPYVASGGPYAGRLIGGIRMVVTDPDRFLPVRTAVCILHALQSARGIDRLWRSPGARPDFFDKLFGTDRVRLALMDGASPQSIADSWTPELAAFRQSRRAALLYPE